MEAMLDRRMEEELSNPWFPVVVGVTEEADREAFTIVRLPSHIHEKNKGLYEPRVVSIGPYHHGSASTRGMESHKRRFLRDFLLRNLNGGGAVRLAAYIELVRTKEVRARRCYGEPVVEVTGTDGFVRLLVLDGLFILELLLKWRDNLQGIRTLDAYTRWMSNYVYYDLLLVENQIPFFVIVDLYDLATKSGSGDITPWCPPVGTPDQGVDPQLLALISEFFSLDEPLYHVPATDGEQEQQQVNKSRNKPSRLESIHHLLHLQYQWLVPAPDPETGTEEAPAAVTAQRVIREKIPLAIPCVTELQEFGVTFKEKTSRESQFDVTFRRGKMEIPRLAISAGTTILLANLFALEQTKDWKKGVVTGYLVLMNALVNTAKDVTVLQRRGVLDNMLSNEQDAAAFFNRLGGCALYDPKEHPYTQVFKDVNKHRNHRWNRYMAVLKRVHFRTPCTIFSLLAGATLLCFSVTSASFVICHNIHRCS